MLNLNQILLGALVTGSIFGINEDANAQTNKKIELSKIEIPQINYKKLPTLNFQGLEVEKLDKDKKEIIKEDKKVILKQETIKLSNDKKKDIKIKQVSLSKKDEQYDNLIKELDGYLEDSEQKEIKRNKVMKDLGVDMKDIKKTKSKLNKYKDDEPFDIKEFEESLDKKYGIFNSSTVSNPTSTFINDVSESSVFNSEEPTGSFNGGYGFSTFSEDADTGVTVDNHVRDVALQVAQGKRYVWGANSDTAVDCSSFAQQVLARLGKDIPRVTWDQMKAGTRVTDPKPGDLVFFNGGSHVGVYIGKGKMIDALNPTAGLGERSVTGIRGTITGFYRY